MRSKKKVVIIYLSIIGLIIILGCIYYFFFLNEKEIIHNVYFTLNGEDNITIEVGTNYEDTGANLIVDSIDKTPDIKVDISNLDTNILGETSIKYYIIIDDKEYSINRTIKVVDTTNPEIKLNGNNTINILKGETYTDPGYSALDNYDGDITDKVEVISNLDNNKVGEYTITYSITDSSGNSSSVERNIIVAEPKKVVVVTNTEEKAVKPEVKPISNADGVSKCKFTSNGFYIEGYKSSNNDLKLILSSSEEYSFNLTNIGNNKYTGNIDLSNVNNDTYKVYIDNGERQSLINKMPFIDRIKRAKIGNKLVTFNYDNDSVSITLEDFSYQYDILIDPGHGGSDTGASNEYIYEKEMNLKVSMYEKCRYESHGYKIYMTRTSDTYGNGMGDSSLPRLHRRAYEMGYYGAVSKVVYSNHHNAINDKSFTGYEILVPASLTNGELSNELNIMNKFNNIYPNLDNHLRFYGRDYDTEKKYNMAIGNTYTFKDNYAVNRIPLNLFDVKSVIYEGCYLTNKEDYNWYWNEEGWIKVSEAKIETYINYLGGTYNSDNSGCLN